MSRQEQLIPILITEVSGPNASDYYTIRAAGGGRYQTNDPQLASQCAQAVGLQGLYAGVSSAERTSRDGRPFTSWYINHLQQNGQMQGPQVQQMPTQIQPQMPQQWQQPPTAAIMPVQPPPPAAPQQPLPERYMNRKHPDEVADIHRQKALDLAIQLTGFKVDVSSVSELITLAKGIKMYLDMDWDGLDEGESPEPGPDDDNIPF